MNTYKDDPTKGLSELQKYILKDLAFRWDNEPGFAECWGVRWTPSKRHWVIGKGWETGQTKSEKVTYSKALARLEKRGLIIRQNGMGGGKKYPNNNGMSRRSVSEPYGGKTTNVVLTESGLHVATQLLENG